MYDDLTDVYDVRPPAASGELHTLVTKLDEFISFELRSKMDMLDRKDKSFGANLLRYYHNMIKHTFIYMKNIKRDVRAHWQRVYRAMVRDYGEQDWEEMWRSFSYEIHSYINDKIRKRLKRKTSNKPSLRREMEKWIDFNHYIKLYDVRFRKFFLSGINIMMPFLESFTIIPFSYVIWYDRRIPENLLKVESIYAKKKGFINQKIWMWYRKEIIILYHKMCQRDIFFIPKPRLSNSETNLVYFAMKKIIEIESKKKPKLLLEGA